MKKQITIISLIMLIACSSIDAAIWRVNGNPDIDADFSSLQTAINDPIVQINDTLYVEGFGASYGNITLIKPLVLIGSGFFLNDNDTTQAVKLATTANEVKFDIGSEGSVITGFNLTSILKIYVDSINVKRNKIHRTDASQNVSAIRIENPGISETTIEGNYIYVKNTSPQSGMAAHGIRCFNQSKLIVKNNYIESRTGNTSSSKRVITIPNFPGNQVFIYNNVFHGKSVSYYTIFYNNIMIFGICDGSNNTFEYNIGSDIQYPIGDGNQQNVDMVTVFVDYTSGIDNGLLLIPGSPAIGTGMNGVDCGIFDGNTPYVLSGIPMIPSIFEFNYTGVGSASVPIQVNIKAKSNN